MTPQEFARFEAKYCPEALTGCWLWTACLSHGYGRFNVGGLIRFAHRLSYEHFVRPLANDEVIDHKCCNRACVNPQHMQVTTLSGNTQFHWDRVGRSSRCPCGHLYKIYSNGVKACLPCSNMRSKRRFAEDPEHVLALARKSYQQRKQHQHQQHK